MFHADAIIATVVVWACLLCTPTVCPSKPAGELAQYTMFEVTPEYATSPAACRKRPRQVENTVECAHTHSVYHLKITRITLSHRGRRVLFSIDITTEQKHDDYAGVKNSSTLL